MTAYQRLILASRPVAYYPLTRGERAPVDLARLE